ncbi:MAG TPA: hypothetical protein VF017_10600 [Thermoanaerobaculia bacterium]|nr:hypothetical protein [Thermoanaerobaculia bacterium]
MMPATTVRRCLSTLFLGLLALAQAPASFAGAPAIQARLLRDCTAPSPLLQAISGPTCVQVASTAFNAGFIELFSPEPGVSVHAVLYPTPDCSGPSVGVLKSGNLCPLKFSNGDPVRGRVRSLYLWAGPDPATLNGTYSSFKGRELRITVQPDGRVSGTLTAAWETSKKKVTVPIFAGLARWMTLGTGASVDPTLPTDDWALTLQLCAGLSTNGFVDDTTCVSYTGAGEMPRGSTKVASLTLQRASVRGNLRGFEVAGEVEVFQRLP